MRSYNFSNNNNLGYFLLYFAFIYTSHMVAKFEFKCDEIYVFAK